LLGEEARLHPDFAGSLPAAVVDWLVERCSGEARMADLVLAGSEYVKSSLIELGVDPSRIAVIPYGVDTERFCPLRRPCDSEFRLLFVGQIGQRKGIKYLLEAVKQLKLPGMQLVLIGRLEGEVEKGLAAYQDYFTHVPNIPHHEVHASFQKADVFVYPSLHEGSAIAIYEALASGLPVITTPNSGSVVRDGVEGFVVPIRNVNALKEKILLLYENKELREQMGQNARKRAEEFTWEAYRERLGGLLHRLLKGQREL
jgi:glycosyltransferase involved in cell wall biosynthesis